MSNHLHAILSAREGYELSAIIRDCKKYTSKNIVSAIQTEPESRREWMLHRFEWAGKYGKRISEYKFWQKSNHAIHFSPHFPDIFKQKFDYIHDNPNSSSSVAKLEPGRRGWNWDIRSSTCSAGHVGEQIKADL